jgi:hypothetical protein
MSKDSSRRNGISSWCKGCRNDSTRKWEAKHSGEPRNRKKVEYSKARDYILKHRYGISQQDYDDLLASQKHRCAICKRDANEMTYHLHVDHCHTSGKVRGLLCSPCNVYLGYVRDNKDALNNAIQYLK